MKINTLLISAAIAATSALPAVSAQAGPDEYLAEVFMTAATFCPRGTAELNGQLLPISQNTALFSLLGTNYGGDGRTTFGLPDMRGRTALHAGRGPGLSDFRQGSRGGSETVTPMSAGKFKTADDGRSAARTGQPQNNRDPYLTMRYCIVTQGVFPSRS